MVRKVGVVNTRMERISSHMIAGSLSAVVGAIIALVVFLMVSGVPALSAQGPGPNIPSYYEGEGIELTLSGIKNPDSCSGSPIRTVDVRAKVSDPLGLYFEGIEATYDLDPTGSISHDIRLPPVSLAAGDYRATYYVKNPICIELKDHPDGTGMSLTARLPDSVYWTAGDITYDTLERRREDCCTGWQILFIVIGGVIGLIVWGGISSAGKESDAAMWWGLVAGGIVWLIISGSIVAVLPGPLKYDDATSTVDWSQSIAIDDGAILGQIYFPEGFDVKKQFKGLGSSAYGYTLAGETTFKVVSTLVDDIEVPRTLLTEGEAAEITAILINREDTDITAEVNLSCNNGFSATGRAEVSAGAFGKLTFTNIILPVGKHVCGLHGKTVELTVVPRPFLAFHETQYIGDLGETILVTGATNFESGSQIVVSVSKQIVDQEYRESYSVTVTAEGGLFEFSIPTGGLPEGNLQVSVSSPDQMTRSSVELVLVKRFTQVSVESITLPRGLLIFGARLRGLASVRNTGNAEWKGSIEILSGGMNVGEVSGNVAAGEFKDLPFEIILGGVGERILQIGASQLPISVMGVPWIRMSADDTVDLGKPVIVSVSTNLTQGQIRIKISRQTAAGAMAGASKIVSITGDANYSVSLDANEPGIYLIESSSLLDLGSHNVQDAFSVQVLGAEGTLIYRLRADPSETIVIGTEAEIHLKVENTSQKEILAPIEVLVNGAQHTNIPTTVKAGEKILKTIPIPFEMLKVGYNTVEIDQRVQQIQVFPLATASGSELVSTDQFTFSLHATETDVLSGTEVLVTAAATNTTTQPLELQMILTLGPGLTTPGGSSCSFITCTWTRTVHAGRTTGPIVSVHVNETSKITLQYSYWLGTDQIKGDLELRLTAR